MVTYRILLFVCLLFVVVNAYYDYGEESPAGSPAYGVSSNDYGGNYQDNEDYNYDYKSSYDYKPSRGFSNDRGLRNHYVPTPRRMRHHQKAYHQTQKKPQKEKVFVPVVIKKKNKKKSKIISVHKGFYTPGGTQMFGKFKDLFSCKKACEITPTCFAGDFNPWLGKCYLHSNLTACASMRSHKAITHFTKVPCDILETTRGFVALGVSTINGIEIKGVKTLSDCIKKCATAGGGVQAADTLIISGGQVCCHIDYDFANHKCYFHACISVAIAQAQFCTTTAAVTTPPLNSVANPTSISITICPLALTG